MSGHRFLFRGKSIDYFEAIHWDGSGMCSFANRLDKGKFIWSPLVDTGVVLNPAKLALLIEGIALCLRRHVAHDRAAHRHQRWVTLFDRRTFGDLFARRYPLARSYPAESASRQRSPVRDSNSPVRGGPNRVSPTVGSEIEWVPHRFPRALHSRRLRP